MRRLLAVGMSLSLLLAGCGDGSLSAGELRSRASAICTRAAGATDRIALPSSADEGARFLREGIARLRPANRRLGRLKAPHDMRASYTRAVALGGLELTAIERQATAIDGGADAVEAFRRLQDRLTPLTGREDAYWRALGVPACVRR